MANNAVANARLTALPMPDRGSALRPRAGGGHRSIVAHGPATGTGPIAIGANATVSTELEISEDGWLDRLVILETGGAQDLVVTSIKVANDELLNGEVPIALFAPDSTLLPPFGHFVNPNTKVRVAIANHGESTANVLFAFSAR